MLRLSNDITAYMAETEKDSALEARAKKVERAILRGDDGDAHESEQHMATKKRWKSCVQN